MHDCGTAILVLLGGGVLWLAVGERLGSRRAGVVFVVSVAALAGFVATQPFAPLFPLVASRAVAAVFWISLAGVAALAIAEAGLVGEAPVNRHDVDGARPSEMPRVSPPPAVPSARTSRAGPTYGLLLIGAAGTIVTAAATSSLDVWLGLELAGIAFAAALRADGASRTPAMSEAFAALLAALLFAGGIALAPSSRLVDEARPAARSVSAGGATSASNRDGTSGSNPAAMSAAAACWIASLGLRLMAAPFHLARWRLRDMLSWRRLAWMLTLARAAPFMVWLRLLASPAGATTAAAVMTGVVAAVSLTVGAVLIARDSSLKGLLCGAAVVQTGCALAALAGGEWSFVFLDAPRPSGAAPWGQVAGAVAFAADALALLTLCLVFDALDAPARPMRTLDDLRGLIRAAPATGAVVALGALALAGVPPLATFWGRLLGLFTTWAVRRDALEGVDRALHPGFLALVLLQTIAWMALMLAALRILDRVVFRGVVGRREPTGRQAAVVVAALIIGALLLGGVLPGLLVAVGTPAATLSCWGAEADGVRRCTIGMRSEASDLVPDTRGRRSWQTPVADAASVGRRHIGWGAVRHAVMRNACPCGGQPPARTESVLISHYSARSPARYDVRATGRPRHATRCGASCHIVERRSASFVVTYDILRSSRAPCGERLARADRATSRKATGSSDRTSASRQPTLAASATNWC